MNSKPHRNNSDFQLKYFLAGSCKTADGAWCLLYGQMIDRQEVVISLEAQKIKRQVKELKAKKVLESSTDEIEKLEAQASLIELESTQYTFEMNAEAAKQELATIKSLMEELEPFRKYSHLPVLEASEACQQEEWLLELQERCENFMITQGTIPHDHFHTMRCHPEFNVKLVPFISKLYAKTSRTASIEDSLKFISKTNYLLEQ